MPTSGIVLDPRALAALSDLVGDDPEAITEIVEAFLDDAPGRLAEIRTGLAGDDLELVRRAAHTLKANGLTFGAQMFATACAELERTAKLGEQGAATTLAGDVERSWDEARPAIAALGA
jgi:HPt (histidine-containing phosphotransfer) domain-containing protein